MVDVTDSVATYGADPLTQTQSDGEVLFSSQTNQWIADLAVVNSVFNGATPISELQVAGDVDVASASPTFTVGTGAGNPVVNFAKSDGGNVNLIFLAGGTATSNRRWIVQFNVNEDLNVLRRTVSGGAQDAPVSLNWTTGAVVVANELEIDGALNHDGASVGFYGTAPAAQPAAYTPSNVTPDRAFDADSTSTAELADVLGTLIADLQSLGLIG